jgi:hypothetical protein
LQVSPSSHWIWQASPQVTVRVLLVVSVALPLLQLTLVVLVSVPDELDDVEALATPVTVGLLVAGRSRARLALQARKNQEIVTSIHRMDRP